MKKLLCLFLCLICICSFAFATDSFRSDACIDEMVLCGFIQGTDDGLELDAPLTRAQAAVFCTRLMGGTYDAYEYPNSHPFTDVPDWASAEVGYLYQLGYVNGAAATRFDAEAMLTAQQFYAMLLRCLGYSEKNGDFSYDDTLGFARQIGLLSADEGKAVSASFNRDGAVIAMYNALRFPAKGSSEPLCSTVSRQINASYSTEVAEVILGESEPYNILRDAFYAMEALDNYTMTQTGTYVTTNTKTNQSVSESYTCTVYSDLNNAVTVYDANLQTTASGTTSSLTEQLYGDPQLMILARNENGTKTVDTLTDVGAAYAYEYAAVHRLFAPDLTYITNFDCTETTTRYLLDGFNCRYDLLYDITSDEMTGYIYDMQIVVDKETHLIVSAEITYTDEWENLSGERLYVDYHVTFSFSNPNSTDTTAKAETLLAALGYEV